MLRALQLAERGRGKTKLNPLVGSVIVHQGRIIGEGWHDQYGGPHAEVNAIQSVQNKELLKDATIYVTLEPCAHEGKTPSCARLIQSLGIPKVVIGCRDPFEKVQGKGIQIIQAGGAEVTEGVCQQEALELIYPFRTHLKNKRPFIHLKWAQSYDGYLGKAGEQTQITHPNTSFVNHKIRSGTDAILVGTNTLRVDNPALDNRLYPGPTPMKIIIDRHGSIQLGSLKAFSSKGKIIVFSPKEVPEQETVFASFLIPYAEPTALVYFILKKLYQCEIGSLMIEGGPELLQSFIHLELWDQCTIFRSKKSLGSGIRAPLVSGKLVHQFEFTPDKVMVLRPFSLK